MREIIATGKTVEEATEAGCRELGLSRDDVSVEILELPVKKLFKNTPAKVRVTSQAEGEELATEAPKAEAKKEEPVATIQETVVQAETKSSETFTVEDELEDEEIPIELEEGTQAKKATDYLLSIFHAMGSQDAYVSAFRQGDATLLRVEGEDVEGLIDTRGETVQALSYLTDRAVNKGIDKKSNEYLRIRLDVAGYRSRREGELVALAERTAKEVIQANRSKTLAPMNPYERLIVHTTISKMEGVMSESKGADTERRIVIRSTAPDAQEGEDWRPPRKGGNPRGGNRGGNNRGPQRGGRGGSGGGRPPRSGGPRGGDRDRYQDRGDRPYSNTPQREYADKKYDPDAKPVVPKRREAIHDGEDLPLYGKIEL